MNTGRLLPLSTVAVGSLPHTQTELALQQSLRLSIPTLPQLPQTGPSEFMLPQALEGLPGLDFNDEGEVVVDEARWRAGQGKFSEKLNLALSGDASALSRFEPSATFCRAWRPFLWEIEQRGVPVAKAQLAGPLTCRWALRLSDERPGSALPELEAQVLQLVTARALAMGRAIRERGVTPLIFLDEPGLYVVDISRPSHFIQLDQLRFVFQGLRRQGAISGLHCCSNTDWERLLQAGPDVLAVDLRLSLLPVLNIGVALSRYLLGGGMLSLGIVPTHSTERLPPIELAANLLANLGERRGAILSRSLLSPACGVGLRSVSDAQEIFSDLEEVRQILQRSLEQ